MERTVRTQRTLSKQDEVDEADEECFENGKRNSGSGNDCSNGSESSGRGISNCSLEDSSSTSGSNSNNNNNSNINNNNNNNVLHRSRSQSKVKLLVRSHAVREETSPPPEPPLSPPPQNSGSPPPLLHHPSNNSTGSSLKVRHKLRREGSSQGSTDSSWEPTLSRGNSREYDNGGSNTVDLQQFIVETLNRNYKDKMLLLKIESELISLAKDPKRTSHKFGQMSSYQRMLVHRVAAYFNMEHNVDPTGASVIVNVTKTTRIPDRRFKEFIRTDSNSSTSAVNSPSNQSVQQSQQQTVQYQSQQQSSTSSQQQPRPKEDLLLPEEPRKSILKRDSSSFDETGCFKSGERMLNGDSRRSKSFEEREEEYEKARRRIFNREHSVEGEGDCMDELNWESESGVCTQCDRVQPHPTSIDRNVRLLKVESYESGDTLRANSLRLAVSKSHSFNGYDPPVHNASQQSQARILTKQDSGSSMSSRISPSSSGYKSQRSDATLSATPSPTATPNLHTQTGQPYTNPDGSIYHFDPSNPPRVLESSTSSSGNSGAGGGGDNGGSNNSSRVGTKSANSGGEWRNNGRGCRSGGRVRNRQRGTNGGQHQQQQQQQYYPTFPPSNPPPPQPVPAETPQYYEDPNYVAATTPVEMTSLVYAVNDSGTTYFYSTPLPPRVDYFWSSFPATTHPGVFCDYMPQTAPTSLLPITYY